MHHRSLYRRRWITHAVTMDWQRVWPHFYESMLVWGVGVKMRKAVGFDSLRMEDVRYLGPHKSGMCKFWKKAGAEVTI